MGQGWSCLRNWIQQQEGGGVMPVHRFYWELIARQNWEAVGIDQRLWGRTLPNRLRLLKVFFSVPFRCWMEDTHFLTPCFCSYVPFHQSFQISHHEPFCFCVFCCWLSIPSFHTFSCSRSFLLQPHFIFYSSAQGVRRLHQATDKTGFKDVSEPIRTECETWISVTGLQTL